MAFWRAWARAWDWIGWARDGEWVIEAVWILERFGSSGGFFDERMSG